MQNPSPTGKPAAQPESLPATGAGPPSSLKRLVKLVLSAAVIALVLLASVWGGMVWQARGLEGGAEIIG